MRFATLNSRSKVKETRGSTSGQYTTTIRQSQARAACAIICRLPKRRRDCVIASPRSTSGGRFEDRSNPRLLWRYAMRSQSTLRTLFLPTSCTMTKSVKSIVAPTTLSTAGLISRVSSATKNRAEVLQLERGWAGTLYRSLRFR
jgi:hypothetical protein